MSTFQNSDDRQDSTDADLAERLAQLSPAKRALLESRLQEKDAGGPVKIAIPCRSHRASAPLSFSQQRLWFLNQLEPAASVYNQTAALSLEGSLNLTALQDALNAIVERHEVLRTTYVVAGDGCVEQFIGAPAMIELAVTDLSECSAQERMEEVQRVTSKLSVRPFDLSRERPLRLGLVKLGETEHVLLLTIHHIASDGWSIGVLNRELSILYNTFRQGKSSPLPDLPIQYADYAIWQREWLKGEELDRQLSYWKKQLERTPGLLNFPTDRCRPAVQSYRGQSQFIELSKDLSRQLKALSRKQGVTLFMTFLAAFQTLLCRYTGQDDIVVGSPIANRTRTELEGLIGFFVNTLVLRSNLSNDPTFIELLAQVRETALGAYAHQDLPFEQLVGELQPERNLSYSPLFQVMLVLQNTPASQFKFDGISVNPISVGIETAKFDLTLYVRESEEGFRVSLQYATDLFESSTIERMAGHFETLLEGIVADPERRISKLPLLTEAEQHQLLVEWNDTEADYPKDKCIHELFEDQVERTPDADAVVFEEQSLSYRELNNRANQLAHHLQKLGVGPDVLVGICIERSLEMVVGLLGILKTGGTYVPLDPDYPMERLEFILNDSGASVLLTKSGFSEGDSIEPEVAVAQSMTAGPVKAKLVRFDRDSPLIDQQSRDNLSLRVAPRGVAYVMYTSGSTGRPKGVVIEHRNAVAFLSWVQSAFTRVELSDVLSTTSICFDLSVFEIFAPLSNGGTVIIAQNSLALAQLPTRSKVTLLNTVPSAMNELLNLATIPHSVRVINLAGETLQSELVRRIYESSAVEKVHDLYGPTECTTYATWKHRTPEGPQTVGRPITNTRTYILDSHLNVVPVGVVGELHIGGDGVARGYLNRPELTREKFIADPFTTGHAGRLYRTGDLARYLADGNIEFLGRIDNQVKIRGYRIELGEVEAMLCRAPSVRDAVVLAREDTPGDRKLVAYITATPLHSPSVQSLRRFLKTNLPDFMIPSTFIFLDSLPLTPNGKWDRKALPLPEQRRPELKGNYLAPRTSIEERIAQVWSEILQVDPIGVNDNFFDLGGHSLLATQVISRLRLVFHREIPLRVMFDAPTIEEMAIAIGTSERENSPDMELALVLNELEVAFEDDGKRGFRSRTESVVK